MQGGVNAFLRSRPPLDLPPRSEINPPLAVCQFLFRGATLVSLLLVAAYALSFAGLTLRGFGWCAILLGIGAFLLLLPAPSAYRPKSFWTSGRWPFQKHVPRWIKYGTGALMFAAFATVLLSDASIGDAEMVDGVYMLYVKGSDARQISREMYAAIAESQVRLAAIWLLVGWFQATCLWWMEMQRARLRQPASR